MKNLPDDPKKIVDLAAKTKALKIENDSGSITLESHNQIDIQPKGTPFGTKIRLQPNGSVTPILTFDTKKTRPKINRTNPKDALDTAIEEYLTGIEDHLNEMDE
jgi:hypothetical protein